MSYNYGLTLVPSDEQFLTITAFTSASLISSTYASTNFAPKASPTFTGTVNGITKDGWFE